MQEIPTAVLIHSICTLLSEAYAGPPDPSGTWFVDNAPDAGILGVLAGVHAVEASASVDGSGQPGSTIAAHVEHLRWSLANVNATLRGAAYNPNWSESWNLHNADEHAWEQLRQDLRAEYAALAAELPRQHQLEGEYLNGVLALVPHAAYHLGVIRQMLERVRAARNSTMEPIPDTQIQDLPVRLSQPARRALRQAGIFNLDQAAAFREAQIRKLHGIGPNAIRDLRAALAARGLAFAAEEPPTGQTNQAE
jgi:hypothetical protein